MVRLGAMIAMDKFNASTDTMISVDQVFEPAANWSPKFKEAKNAYPTEFRLVRIPSDMAQDEECIQLPEERAGKESEEK